MSDEPFPGQTAVCNRVEIYFEVRGRGAPLLLLHGFSGSGQDWMPSLKQWGSEFQLILADLRGHGRSAPLANVFRHRDAAADMLALLDQLGIGKANGVGISGGGNVLLHMAAAQPNRVEAMVLVSATPYFPDQARAIMRHHGESLPQAQREALLRRHPRGDVQIESLLASTRSFADSYDDMDFTPRVLSTIQARTLIVQGDRDPLYPIELSIELFRGIPNSALWVIPNAGHGPVIGERWPEFVAAAARFVSARPISRDKN
ncbi:MAG TPA: alpha/beta fold hydrolase [Terriglobales bacterium]|nr:alpha/beta fold hydrolase [Terriglobales bacterium]